MEDSKRLAEWIVMNSNNNSNTSSTIASKTKTDYYVEKLELILKDILKNFYYDPDSEYCREVGIYEDRVYLDVIYFDHVNEYLLSFDIDPITEDWRFELEAKDQDDVGNRQVVVSTTGTGYNQLLDKLLKMKIIKNKKLFESIQNSFAEDFKLYENLFD